MAVQILPLLIKAAITAGMGAASSAAAPQYGMKTPGAVPENGSGEGGFNFEDMVQQEQASQLEKLLLEDRLPLPPQY